MNMKVLFLILSALVQVLPLAAQTVDLATLRADSLGTQKARREGIMNGNRISTLVYNNGEIGQWPSSPSIEWPKGSQLSYLDGLCFLVGASVDSVVNPVNRTKFNRITPLETHYREEMDETSTVPYQLIFEPWGFTPLPDYSHPGSSTFAFSSDPASWPAVWPAALGWPQSKNGTWVTGTYPFSVQTDLECFYVMDDSKDCEWTRPPKSFYPILSDTPAVATTPGSQWYNPAIRKGLGLRVESRLFQWNRSGLEDALFGTHDVINLSDHDYDSATVGLYAQPGFGSNLTVEDGSPRFQVGPDYVLVLNGEGYFPGQPQVTPGKMAVVLLETPGCSDNNRDDDQDGLTNESQLDGLDNDGDWSAVTDDLGEDGLKETGDTGEGDGLPTAGEPNFDATDPDESDQNGMRSVVVTELSGKSVRDIWPRNDEVVVNKMMTERVDTAGQTPNIQILISNGTFLLKKGDRRRFAFALVMAESVPELIGKMKTVRAFYNSGYRFVSSPDNVEEAGTLPGQVALDQNYPNPFNPDTRISYRLPQAGQVRMSLVNTLGQQIRVLESGLKPAGSHSVSISLGDLPSGVYFYTLESGTFRQTRKLVLMK